MVFSTMIYRRDNLSIRAPYRRAQTGKYFHHNKSTCLFMYRSHSHAKHLLLELQSTPMV